MHVPCATRHQKSFTSISNTSDYDKKNVHDDAVFLTMRSQAQDERPWLNFAFSESVSLVFEIDAVVSNKNLSVCYESEARC